MRRFSLKPYCWLLLLAGLVTTLAGCGADGDILEPNTQRYTAFVSSLQDAEEDDVITIDVYRDSDCDDNGTADDPEPWTDVLADITVSVDEKAPGLTLTDYTIQYIPLRSPDTQGVYRTGPDLIDLTDHGSFTFSVPSGTEAEFTITCLSIDSKIDYRNHWLNDADLANLAVARYTIRITMYFVDEYSEERSITVERTVYLSNYDNC